MRQKDKLRSNGPTEEKRKGLGGIRAITYSTWPVIR